MAVRRLLLAEWALLLQTPLLQYQLRQADDGLLPLLTLPGSGGRRRRRAYFGCPLEFWSVYENP